MDLNEFIKYKDYNFFAYICTPWQIKGVEVAINAIKKRGENVKGVVFLADHNITGRTIYKKDCPLMNEIEWIEVDNEEYNKIYKTDNKIKRFYMSEKNFKLKNEVYVFCPGIINIGWLYLITAAFDKGISVILGDDGAGGYIGYGNAYKNNIIKLFVHEYFETKLYRSNRIIDQRILTKNKQGYVRNEELAKEYSCVLSESGNDLSQDVVDDFSNKILLNTQCLYDNKGINGEQDLNTLQHLYDVLGDRNREVVIKPHPRELSLDRYNRFPEWKVITGVSITQEEIFAKLKVKPKAIIGMYSSTLINLKALFGVETISLANFYEREDISSDEKEICVNFVREFDGFVRCPKTDKDLKELIKGIYE